MGEIIGGFLLELLGELVIEFFWRAILGLFQGCRWVLSACGRFLARPFVA